MEKVASCQTDIRQSCYEVNTGLIWHNSGSSFSENVGNIGKFCRGKLMMLGFFARQNVKQSCILGAFSYKLYLSILHEDGGTVKPVLKGTCYERHPAFHAIKMLQN